jgi:hypothetical protein
LPARAAPVEHREEDPDEDEPRAEVGLPHDEEPRDADDQR